MVYWEKMRYSTGRLRSFENTPLHAQTNDKVRERLGSMIRSAAYRNTSRNR